jgi:glucosamine-phosphate N-acetyltransferase
MEIRKLTYSHEDYMNYHELINEFRPTTFNYDQFYMTLHIIEKSGEVWVIQKDGVLIATATIIYEHKFIHNITKLAHVEDVCVMSSYRRHGYGKLIIKHLYEQARKQGCYKITLDCSDSNIGFYESCKLTRRGNQMCELIDNLFPTS